MSGGSEMQREVILRMEQISKSYGKVVALDRVDVDVRRGEILALVGDNGAGKSTLVKIMSGILTPDSGRIILNGEQVSFRNSREARRMGIDSVEQNLSLVNIMSIARNFFLGRELFRRIGPVKVLDLAEMNRACKAAVEDIGVRVRSADDLVSTLSGGERQAISIGRAFYFGCRILLLDEPLAALSVKESRKVHDMVTHFRDEGASIVYITHNVFHVYPIADRFVLIDRGRRLAMVDKAEVTPEQVMEAVASGRWE